jgi:putative DNA primase/helicase
MTGSDFNSPAIRSMFNGFFLLSEEAWLNEGKKVPKKKRNTDLYSECPANESYVAGELRDGLVVLDFDDEEQGKFIVSLLHLIVDKQMIGDIDLKYNVVKTEHGYHIYFKNPDLVENPKGHVAKRIPPGNVAALGVECEYKIGADFQKNGDYEPLKLGDNQREFIGEVYSFDELSDLPFFLYHFKKRESIFKMKEGSRNVVLSEFALGLQKIMEPEDVDTTCRIINGMVFTDKLPKSEVDTILRPETFQKTLPKGNKPDKL